MADTAVQATDATGRKQWKLLVNGQQVDAASGESFEVINPATNETLATVAKGGREDIDLAVSAAREAYNGKWTRMGAARRAGLLYKVAQIMRDRSDEIARLEVSNNGKAISQAKAELNQA